MLLYDAITAYFFIEMCVGTVTFTWRRHTFLQAEGDPVLQLRCRCFFSFWSYFKSDFYLWTFQLPSYYPLEVSLHALCTRNGEWNPPFGFFVYFRISRPGHGQARATERPRVNSLMTSTLKRGISLHCPVSMPIDYSKDHVIEVEHSK